MPVMDRLFLPLQGAMASYPIDPASRVAAGEWSGSHLRQVGHWILSTDVACFAIGLDGLIDAVLSFQRQDLHPLIEEMIERFLQIDLLAIQAQTHASLTGCRALLRWATFSSNEALAEAAELRYRRFTDFAWTETYANFNWFGRPQWTEPCAAVDAILLAMDLWRRTSNDRYLADAHLMYFNALAHGQRPSSWPPFLAYQLPRKTASPDSTNSSRSSPPPQIPFPTIASPPAACSGPPSSLKRSPPDPILPISMRLP